ncbi:MAG: 16S rRNA (uracil(1498)-N(3))-methyltransferase, partial [Sinomicrobium sp.]|nr:16S rRNA (uracil(1498)-N(3))-methyltransferase [Sinomicrobium sp.]
MQLFYHPDIDDHTEFFSFDAEASGHLVKVLRKSIGDRVHVTNGRNRLFEAGIIEADPKKCTLKILRTEWKPARNYIVHMAVAPTKMNDRYEWFLEKAVEIGVDEITPLICDRSERKTVKSGRFEKIIIAAMKQSLQYRLPRLNAATPFREFVNRPFKGQLFIAHCGTTER